MFAVNVDVVIDVVKYAQTAHLKLGNFTFTLIVAMFGLGPNAVTIYVEIKY